MWDKSYAKKPAYSGVMDAVITLLKGQFAPDRDGTLGFSDPT